VRYSLTLQLHEADFYSVTADANGTARFPCYPHFETYAHFVYELHFVSLTFILSGVLTLRDEHRRGFIRVR